MKSSNDVTKVLRDIGVGSGMSVLVHHHPLLHELIGGPATLVNSLLEIVGVEGTVCSFELIRDNREPSLDEKIDFEERPAIRRQLELFDYKRYRDIYYNPTFMALTKTPGRLFNNHPYVVFCVNGKFAKYMVRQQPLDFPFGLQSSFKALNELDGYILHFGHQFDDCHELKLVYSMNESLQSIAVNGAAWGNQWTKYLDYETDVSLYEKAVSMCESKKELIVDGLSIQFYKYQDVLTMYERCLTNKFKG